MASSFNAPRVVQAAVQALANTNPVAARAGRILQAGDAGQVQVGGRAIGGTANTLAGNATSATVSDAFSYSASFTPAKKYIKHVIPMHTLRTDYALADAGSAMAEAITKALDKEFVTGLEGLFAAAHARAGAGAGQVGAAKMFLDTGLAYLATEAGAGTQDNLITSALSESALNTAIKLMLSYRSDRGHPLDLGSQGGLVLVVAPKNAQTAHELVVSQLSGSDMASNFIKGLISDVVVTPHLSADDDDWFLIDRANSPVGLAIGAAPQVTVSTTTDGLFCEIVGSYESVFFRSPYEAGIIGSNVA